MIRRTRVEVDLGAIVDNARIVARHVGTSVAAVVKADGKLFSATKETKVTLGGCGG